MPLVGLVSAAALGGCGAGEHSPASGSLTTISSGDEVTTGTLAGQVVYVGGPAPGSPRPLAGGAVMFEGAERTTATMSQRGRFFVELEAGVYVVTATSPDYKSSGAVCEAAHPVRVSAGKASSVRVFCQVR